ncbi:Serine-threonine/tyrosine-protein kinase, catalytic domain [Dillenia turbinata]|uniref:Serine-threonine/tyrosine-protein kinase, catalytic domain n=1 Tax=Dillenia turbinata TaxID=194707 RepID=A0AAN8Z3X5_9MAGN
MLIKARQDGDCYSRLFCCHRLRVNCSLVPLVGKEVKKEKSRNLVQLIGWCHEQDELLLVYEYMTNGSLDFHLFGKKVPLTRTVRYKIALGLASSLLLSSRRVGTTCGAQRCQDEQCHATWPECIATGKSRKEFDVYSFGVVALEISFGRRLVDTKAEPSKVMLVEWVWDLYGRQKVLEAADKLLKDYNERQVERLMGVGLWCCHPDYTYRPSIWQVTNVLNFESSLPNLPSKMLVPMYFAPPMHLCKFSYISNGLTDLEEDYSRCSDTCTTSSSGGSSKDLL